MDTTMWEILAPALMLAAGIVAYFETAMTGTEGPLPRRSHDRGRQEASLH